MNKDVVGVIIVSIVALSIMLYISSIKFLLDFIKASV
jgi:hypothetical protein